MRSSADSELMVELDCMTCARKQKAQDLFQSWALGEQPLASTDILRTEARTLALSSSFAGHQRLSHDPHLIQWHSHHDEEAEHHEGVSREHG